MGLQQGKIINLGLEERAWPCLQAPCCRDGESWLPVLPAPSAQEQGSPILGEPWYPLKSLACLGERWDLHDHEGSSINGCCSMAHQPLPISPSQSPVGSVVLMDQHMANTPGTQVLIPNPACQAAWGRSALPASLSLSPKPKAPPVTRWGWKQSRAAVPEGRASMTYLVMGPWPGSPLDQWMVIAEP